MSFYDRLNVMPQDVKNIIYNYIPKIALTFLNKSNYNENHKIVRNYINKKHLENYIRKIVRQDNSFVFNKILNENLEKWLNIKNYYHKDCIYANYLIFLNSYCIDYESFNCKKLIVELMEKQGFLKNQHKKKYIKYIRSIN